MIRPLLAALLFVAAPAFAQPAAQGSAASEPVAALSWLVGSWRGAGTMMGNAGEATLAVRPVLGGRFLEFSYRAGLFEGRAFYSAATGGRWQARWFDNRGVTFSISATLAGRQLTSEWGDAATERGRTVYRLAEDGRLYLTDAVRRPDGSYRDFATHVLTRSE